MLDNRTLTLPQIGDFFGSETMIGLHALNVWEQLFGETQNIDVKTLRGIANDLYGFRYGLDKEFVGVTDLQGIQTNFIAIMRGIRERWPRLGYVAGIVSSDGPDHIERNMDILRRYEAAIRSRSDYPVFSSADLFSRKVYGQVRLSGLTNQAFMDLWKGIFEAGFITDVSFTPRWENSEGARDEYKNASFLGMNIEIVYEDILPIY
jgi:hypothetical protein